MRQYHYSLRQEIELRFAVEKQAKEISAISHSQSGFFEIMGHQIEAPVHGVVGVARTLQRSLRGKELVLAKVIETAGKGLLSLVSDMQEESQRQGKAQTGEEKAKEFNLHKLLSDVSNLMSGVVQYEDKTLTTDFSGSLPEKVMGNAFQLKRILTMLLSVALRDQNLGRDFTFGCFFDHTHDTSKSDNGVLTFQLFSKVTVARLEKDASGWKTCQHFVEAAGGYFSVKGNSSGNLICQFSFPISVSQRASDTLDNSSGIDISAQGTAVGPLKILLVDDNNISREVTKGMLVAAEHAVHIAKTGAEAFTLALEIPFDIILMDINLPDANGVDVAKALNLQRRRKDETALIFALTANAFPEDVLRYHEEGMAGVLTKPFDLKALEDALLGVEPSSNTIDEVIPVLDETFIKYEIAALGVPLILNLLDDFEQEITKSLKGIHDAASVGNTDAVFRGAHLLSGMSGSFGMFQLSQRCKSIESETKDGNNGDYIALLGDLDDIVGKSIVAARARLNQKADILT